MAIGLQRQAATRSAGKARSRAAREADELYEMANLYPRETGLPVTVWVSPRGRARHAARVKVCRKPGDRMDVANTASVRIQPAPLLVEGVLAPEVMAPVSAWITLNTEALIEYWNGTLGTMELAQRLRKL